MKLQIKIVIKKERKLSLNGQKIKLIAFNNSINLQLTVQNVKLLNIKIF